LIDNRIMNNVTPRRPQGFQEYLPAQQLQFDFMVEKIIEIYRLYGLMPINTPALELADVLLAKGGGETEKEIYRFSKGDKEYALRYDLTIPLARYVSEHKNDLTLPFRRYQIQKVWRAERPQKGRYREFVQCDADIIGSSSMGHDAELIAMAADIFRSLKIGKFTIKINNRKILSGFIEEIGLSDKSEDIMHALDKIEKIGRDEVGKLLKGSGCGDDDANQLLDFVSITGSNNTILDKLEGYKIKNKQFAEGISDLRQVLKYANELGADDSVCSLNLGIVRGLDYYTGTVYETTLDDRPDFGSVCSGGRYDDLTKYFSKSKLPGVGISIGLSRLFAALLESGEMMPSQEPVEAFVANFGAGSREWALKISNDFRAAGIRTQVDLDGDKPAKQFKYADRLKVPYTVVVGEIEAKNKLVQLKNMSSGQQEELAIDTAIIRIKNHES